jgi:lipoyl(octanoyl) transferase
MSAPSSEDCHWSFLGLVPYDQARRLQEDAADDVGAGAPAQLLLLEHPHVYTFGRRGREENLLWDREQRAAHGVEVRWVDRGGDVTYHGPGQLVGYPILRLGSLDATGRIPQADYVGFLRKMEQSLIVALARLGLVTGRIEGLTGVWIQPDVASRCPRCPPAARHTPAKLASIGVRVDSKGISRHGFSLNVAPDMSYWDGIIACGIVDRPPISLAQLLDPTPSVEEVARVVVEAFGETFGYRMVRDEPPAAGVRGTA